MDGRALGRARESDDRSEPVVYDPPMRAARMLALLVAASAGCSSARTRTAGGGSDASPAADASAVAPFPDAGEAEAVPEPDPLGPDGEGAPTSEEHGGVAPIVRKDAPALRYARLDRASCEAELARRTIPFVRAGATPGVRSPVRLAGALHGVTIHSGIAEKKRKKAAFEIFDCRLVLALDDFTELLARHDVVEVVHMSAYRSKKQNGCTSKVANQHCGALAVDIGTFVKRDGTRLVVDRDYQGKIGGATCSADAPPRPRTPAGEELRSFVCESARRVLFNVILTPSFNAAHHDHFHVEVTPGASWLLVH